MIILNLVICTNLDLCIFFLKKKASDKNKLGVQTNSSIILAYIFLKSQLDWESGLFCSLSAWPSSLYSGSTVTATNTAQKGPFTHQTGQTAKHIYYLCLGTLYKNKRGTLKTHTQTQQLFYPTIHQNYENYTALLDHKSWSQQIRVQTIHEKLIHNSLTL